MSLKPTGKLSAVLPDRPQFSAFGNPAAVVTKARLASLVDMECRAYFVGEQGGRPMSAIADAHRRVKPIRACLHD
jgi:hypothetical protein